ncbi:MAG: 23S rRNA (uracil(1939)-C(5))-methyltransferase RlmD [Bacteroidetes bacterium]|nr:23S rRNA (uracil(1939)-C(5))-methyltransferase RlmD [Bacteroidota bacterium]MDA0887956.1 23S rRNA (uracil(1939)-C(5))-methyltransferase RlmD [Bacteroidota bacterium]MDA1083910.1 23S rRNA (uracil(1939)-C(5))-methyltransferase RlmD [Bacteroidota bacterium]
MRRNKTIPPIEKLSIDGIAKKGKGVGRTEEGQVVFVQGAIPGDIIDVTIQKKRRRHLEGKIAKIHKESADRILPKCSHFGTCGGCTWQHMHYDAQLRHKQQEVIDALERIGGVDVPEYAPIIGCENIFGYRNKMEFSFSARRWLTAEEISGDKIVADRSALGFHIPGMWDKIVDISHCHIQPELPNTIRNEVKAYARKNELSFFDARDKVGFLRSLMLRTTLSGEIMVVIQFFHEDSEAREGLLNHLITTFPNITSLQYIINEKANDTIYDQEIHHYKGTPYITEKMGNLAFRITPKAFYQTNPAQAEVLYTEALALAELKKSDVVYDLYTGLGTIAQFVANSCEKVIGIESVPDAITAAKENAKRNNITNTKFEVGDMRKVFTDDFVARHGKADVIITDPPRDGMHKEVINQLLELKTSKILYISCNPQTQARDLALLNDVYKVIISQAVDMFPHTQHVENIVLLELRK